MEVLSVRRVVGNDRSEGRFSNPAAVAIGTHRSSVVAAEPSHEAVKTDSIGNSRIVVPAAGTTPAVVAYSSQSPLRNGRILGSSDQSYPRNGRSSDQSYPGNGRIRSLHSVP